MIGNTFPIPTMAMMKIERTVKRAIHILPFKNGVHKVYVADSVTAKRVFSNYKEAMAYAEKLQKKDRVPIIVHREDGLVVQTIVPSEVRRLKPLDGKPKKSDHEGGVGAGNPIPA